MTAGRPVPGTVVWASVLTLFHGFLAVLGVGAAVLAARPAWVVISAILMVLLFVGAVGLARLRPWARPFVLTISILSWVAGVAIGRIEFVGTTIVVIVLLLLPSTRASFAQSWRGDGNVV